MKKICLIAIISLCQLSLIAQKKDKFRFSNLSQAGLVMGSTSAKLQVQTINGISYKTFSAGIGIGFDNYYFETIPLFLDLRKNLWDKKHTPFAYADIGVSFPRDRKELHSQWESSRYFSGLYYDLGVGYQFRLKRFLALNMSAGYSQKSIKETKEYTAIIFDELPGVGEEYYKYYLRRVTVKLGLSF